MSLNARVLIMDEPTAALSQREVERLFTVVNDLRQHNVAMMFVGHRMDEIFRIADRIAVLRDGRLIGVHPKAELGRAAAIAMMVGREVTDLYPERSAAPGKIMLETRALSRSGAFAAIDLQLRAGEVVGLGGLVGSGRTEIARVLFGIDQPDGGELLIDGNVMRIGYVVLYRTATGRELFAVGSNPDGARLIGIPADRRIVAAFAMAGLLGGLCGALWASRYATVDACVALGFELTVIASAVVGGVAIRGGSGRLLGIVLGAFTRLIIKNGLTLVRVDPLWLQGVYRLVILVTVGALTLLITPDARSGKVGPNRLELLKSYVAAGGGLMLAGGYMGFQGMFGTARFADTAVEDVLPVRCLPHSDGLEVPEGLTARLLSPTHPILAGIDEPLPPILGLNKLCFRADDASSLLAVCHYRQTGWPLLAVRNYGKGRSVIWSTDIGPHWLPLGFLQWRCYGTLMANIVTWVCHKDRRSWRPGTMASPAPKPVRTPPDLWCNPSAAADVMLTAWRGLRADGTTTAPADSHTCRNPISSKKSKRNLRRFRCGVLQNSGATTGWHGSSLKHHPALARDVDGWKQSQPDTGDVPGPVDAFSQPHLYGPSRTIQLIL